MPSRRFVFRSSVQSLTTSTETLAFTAPIGREGFVLIGLRRPLRLPRTKTPAKKMAMKWKTPVIGEIAVGLEINTYACAEVK